MSIELSTESNFISSYLLLQESLIAGIKYFDMIVVFQLVSILHNRKILGHCMIALE